MAYFWRIYNAYTMFRKMAVLKVLHGNFSYEANLVGTNGPQMFFLYRNLLNHNMNHSPGNQVNTTPNTVSLFISHTGTRQFKDNTNTCTYLCSGWFCTVVKLLHTFC